MNSKQVRDEEITIVAPSRYMVLHNDEPVRTFEFMTLACLFVIEQDRPDEYRIEVVSGRDVN